MKIIDQKFIEKSQTPSDINEHFPILKKYAEQSSHITEMGVRHINSTWALLAGFPKRLIGIDIDHPSVFGGNLQEVLDATKEANIEYSFIKSSSLNIVIENTDLLFIDTYHSYSQLIQELSLHVQRTNKYIIMHDTTFYGTIGEDRQQDGGLNRAIKEFLEKNNEWNIEAIYNNNNGLTILKRK